METTDHDMKTVTFADASEEEMCSEAPPFAIEDYCFYENSDNQLINLIRITRVTDVKLTVHCYGTQTKYLDNARLTPVSVDNSGHVLLYKPRATDKAKPFVSTILLKAVSNEIVARDIKLRKIC